MSKTRWILTILLICLDITSLYAYQMVYTPDSSFNYTIEDGEVTIDLFTGTEDDVRIPPTIEGYPVTALGDIVFAANEEVVIVTIPEGVRSIGYGAFLFCEGLREVNLPDSLTALGEEAFGNCTDLPKIRLPDGVTAIEAYTFAECEHLESIRLPGNLRSIGSQAFLACRDLDRILIPRSVETIAADAFLYCDIDYFYCEAPEKPAGWAESWAEDGLSFSYGTKIIWGYERQ